MKFLRVVLVVFCLSAVPAFADSRQNNSIKDSVYKIENTNSITAESLPDNVIDAMDDIVSSDSDPTGSVSMYWPNRNYN